MPKATAVFDADDSRLSGARARINGRMRRRRLQSDRLQSKRRRGGAHVAVAGVDGGASFLRRAGAVERVGGAEPFEAVGVECGRGRFHYGDRNRRMKSSGVIGCGL